ncbi:MAG: hypothetical protein HYV97_13750 [Bdellovibrio sp.]|nr:hypothetical protein [Bdellovibrio sp.]
MSEQNSKLPRSEKINKLQMKFHEVESLAETIAQSDLLQNIASSANEPPAVLANARVEEEIVLWKKQSHSFRTNNDEKAMSGTTPKVESEWEQFTHNIRFMAPSNIDLVFSNIPKNTDGMGKLFQQICRILKKYPDFFNLSVTQKFRGSSESMNENGRCSVLLGLDVEALKTNQTIEEMRHNQDSKLKTLRFLYQIKCREESDEIKIQLQHNKSTLEASEFIVIVFVYSPVVEKVVESSKAPQSKMKRKSNLPLEM